MCHFISWIDLNGEIYFLDDNKLNTKEGRELLKKCSEDILGHGAIRAFYPELKSLGKDCECEDFSSPNNFPSIIVKTIKKGLFSQFSLPNGVLNKNIFNSKKKADAEWKKAYAEWKKADAEWKKADAEWEKADAEWEKAYAEWEKAELQIFWRLVRQKENRVKSWK